MKDHYEFGKRLTRLLQALDMTQMELSRRTQLTPAAISELCAGIRDPSLHTIVRIMKVIPVKFETLVNMENKDGT